MRTLAPAKINWTLEVLGRREDGYHEIRSVMQTIDLCDEVKANRAPDLLTESTVPGNLPSGTVVAGALPHRFYYAGEGSNVGPSGMLGESVIRAVALLDPEGRKDARVSLSKKIPIAAGLGGGSSDAAAALRALQRLWDLGLDREGLTEIGSDIGSDVPFFLYGGVALVEGRGEQVTPVRDSPVTWFVLVAPPIKVPEKTKRMYEALTGEDFNDGSRSEALVRRVRQGKAVGDEDLYNVFERVAFKVFEGLGHYREALLAAGATTAHLAGAGPALFAITRDEPAAKEIAQRIQVPDAKVFVTPTLTASEATTIGE